MSKEKNKELVSETESNSAVQLLDKPSKDENKPTTKEQNTKEQENKSPKKNPKKKPIEQPKETSKSKETKTQETKANISNEKVPVVINQNNKLSETSKEPEKQVQNGLNVFSIFGILLSILVLIIIISFLIFSAVMSNNDKIFSGIYIKDIDVSNMSKEDAKNALKQYIENNIPEEIILIHNDAEFGLNTEELNINFDINASVEAAFNIGKSHNLFIDGFDILSTALVNKTVEPGLTLDEEVLEKMLSDISSKLPDKLIESGYYIDGNNLILNKGANGNSVDIKKSKQTIINEIKNLNLNGNRIELSVRSASPSKLDIDKIYEEVHKEATNAEFIPDPISVKPSENGIDFSISLEEAKSKLNEDNQECVIPLKVVYPSVTTNMIGTEAFPDKLSEFSTRYAASNVNRTTNLRLAASKINGTVLMPGEVFSYNQVVGERTIAAGYKEAPIYVSGRVEDGLGGGICQITTTLYNAAAYANLEIIERTNHQFVPSYVGAGRDATVVYGAIDFKFKNNRNYPIKILCSVASGIANFQILGLKTENDYDVEIYSRITSQSASYTNSETYKILKQNGNVVSQELLSRDTYKRH